jgi:hypothetical protein
MGTSSRGDNALAVAGDMPAVPRWASTIIRLVGAVLVEQNHEWAESHRHMGLDILAACRKAAHADPGKDNTNEAGLTIDAIPACRETW